MANKHGRPEHSQDSQSQTQLELLEALLLADVPYPWNPASPESETYLAALEEEFVLEDWSADEVDIRSQELYTQLDQLWPVATPAASKTESAHLLDCSPSPLNTDLHRHFAAHVPASWLDVIAHQALHLLSTNLSLAEQLVQCVRQLLPHWAEEDLQVLARPIAYAMRGTDPGAIESTLAGAPAIEWTELSEIEQVRISLAVARYALTKVKSE